MKSLNRIFMMLLNKSVFLWQGKVILLLKYKTEKIKNKKYIKCSILYNSFQFQEHFYWYWFASPWTHREELSTWGKRPRRWGVWRVLKAEHCMIIHTVLLIPFHPPVVKIIPVPRSVLITNKCEVVNTCV